MKKVTVGVDIGGTSIKIGLVDELGSVINKFSYPVDKHVSQEKMIEDMGKYINEFIEKEVQEKDILNGIGIGCPGCINVELGTCDFSNNLNWFHLNVVEIIEKTCNLPCKISNDANAATLGEVRYGCGKGYKNVVMLTLGTGVGGGIVINGHLYEGNQGKGAELGHSVIKMNGRKCTCGRRGCFETYASATSLVKEAKAAMKKNLNSALWAESNGSVNNVNGKIICECAKKGDKTANMVLDTYFEYLKEGILNYCNIFRPELIIIGGGLSNQKDFFLSRLIPLLEKEHYGFLNTPKVEVKCATLGNDAGIIGAAALFD